MDTWLFIVQREAPKRKLIKKRDRELKHWLKRSVMWSVRLQNKQWPTWHGQSIPSSRHLGIGLNWVRFSILKPQISTSKRVQKLKRSTSKPSEKSKYIHQSKKQSN